MSLRKKFTRSVLGVFVALTIALAACPTLFAFAEEAPGTAASDSIQLIDFCGNGRAYTYNGGTYKFGPNSKVSSLPGASEDEIAQAKAYVAGGEDLDNIYSLAYSEEISAGDRTVSGAEVISHGSTGDLFIALGRMADNDQSNPSGYDQNNAPFFKDYESFNIEMYVENPAAIERMVVRLSDDYLLQNCSGLVQSADFGWQYTFNGSNLGEGQTYVEMDLDAIPAYDTFYSNNYEDHVKFDDFLRSIKGGIKGNRPIGEDRSPLRASYIQIVVQFNIYATPENPARIVFDSVNLSKSSVAPQLSLVSEEALSGETGSPVSLKDAIEATDNRNTADELRYRLSVSREGTPINSNQIDAGNLSFTPYKAGEYTAKVTAVDADGNESEIDVKINVTGEDVDVDAPVVNSATLDAFRALSPLASFDPVDLTTVTFTDDYSSAEEITVTYAVTCNDSGEAYAVKDGKFTPDRNGRYTVVFTATDKAGNSTNVSVNITVNNPNTSGSDISGNTGSSSCNSCGGSMAGGTFAAMAVIALAAFAVKRK